MRIDRIRRLFRRDYPGEMLPYERERLSAWVTAQKPGIVFEVGTGLGGGSTYCLCKALQASGGVLFSCDPDRRPGERFMREFADVLRFFPAKSSAVLDMLEAERIVPDFIFFDGPEEPEVALTDLKRLEKIVRTGARFAMHDWHPGRRPYDGAESRKAALVRPYVERSPLWGPLEVLHGDQRNSPRTRTGYDSVGLCLYERTPQ